MGDAIDVRRALEFGTSVFVSVLAVLATTRLGIEPILALAALAVIFVAGVGSPVAFAAGVVVLSPIPSIEGLVGVTLPLGLDPLNVLAGIGLTIVLLKPRTYPLRRRWLLHVGIGAYLAVFAAAWWRVQTQNADADAVALLAKPLVTLVAAVLAVQLLPPARRRAIPVAMAAMLVAVSVSIVLQRLGVYTTAHQELRGAELGIKQFGGLMLDGNSAGALIGIFAVPVYVLLSSIGYRRAGFAVLLSVLPVLLITFSRSGMLGFAVGLLYLLLSGRAAHRATKTVVGVVAFAAVWASTAGRDAVTQISGSVATFAVDVNAASSGREQIWTQVLAFLAEDRRRWFVGGGLDSFREFALSSPLQHAFSTHNIFLKLITDGGLLLAGAGALVVVALWRIGSGDDSAGHALRASLVSLLTVGLAVDVDLFGRVTAWVWVLAALAATQSAAARTAVTNRSAIASTPQGSSGARIAPRASEAAT